MPDRDKEFLDFYEQQRVEDQLDYYRRQSSWHGRRDDLLIVVTGILMFVASACAALVGFGGEEVGSVWVWTLVAAFAPVFSVAVAATCALYEHERNHQRFENTYLDLEYLRAYRAPSSSAAPEEYHGALTEYVTEVEGLLSREHRQWVQMTEAAEQAEPPASTLGQQGEA